MAIKKINTDLQIEAGLLDGDGNSGVLNQVLVSTGTGVDWVDGSGSGIIGGPYLPLAGGTMTGNIAMGNNNITGLSQLAFTDNLRFDDLGADNYLRLTYGDTGPGGLQIYDGDNTLQGYLYADGGGTSSFGLLSGAGQWGVKVVEGANTSLYYNAIQKLFTTDTGIDVTGIAQMDTGITEGIHYVGTGVEHWGDGGTGMSFPANDVISFKTTSSDRLYINSSGNVGIGTTSPDSLLELENSPAAQTQSRLLHIDNNPTNNQGSGYIEISSGSNNQAKTQIEQVSSGGFGLLGNQYIDTNIINRGLSSSAQGNINFATGSSTSATSIVMTIGGGSQKGNVGIGTASPSQKLEVNGNAIIGGGTLDNPQSWGKILQVQNTGSNGAGISVKDSNNEWNLATYNGVFNISDGIEERIIINSSGNVGIGTASPGKKLTVSNGSSGFTGSYNGRTASVFEGSDSAGTTISIMSPDTGYSGIFFGNNTSETYGQLAFDHTSNSFKFLNGGGSERMRITSAGNVGIGTTTTNYKLEVNNTSAGNLTTALTLNNGSSTTNTAVALRLQTDPTSTVNSYSEIRSTRTNSPAAGGVAMRFLVTNSTTGAASEIMRLSYAGLGIGTAGTTTITDTRRGAFADGTAAAPAYSFSDDTNNGMYRITTDTLGFSTAGSEKLRISSAGNVGIGTTGPTRVLTISKLDTTGGVTSSQTSVIRLNNPTSAIGAYTGIQFGYNSNAPDSQVHASIGTIQDSTSSTWGGRLAFATKANTSNGVLTEYMSILTGGNVGIGTTSPVFKLDVHNSGSGIRHYGDSTNQLETFCFGGYQTIIATNGSVTNEFGYAAGNFYVQTADTEKFRITSSGNVGIGTDSPSEKLDVNGNLIVSGNFNNLYVGGKTNSNVDGIRMLCAGDDSYIDCRGGSGLNFRLDDTTGDTQRIKFHSGGNVSIGNTNNTYKLDVQGTGNFAGNLQISTGDQATTRLLLKNTNSTGGRTFALVGGIHNVTQDGFSIYDTVAAATRFTILNNGNVGIGTTSPGYQLQLSTNSAAKPTSNVWTVVSDSRVKENVRTYDSGLDKVLQIEPKLFDYNGKAGFEKTKDNVGIIAQEIKKILPETVNTYKAKLNEGDEEETELYSYDGHALTFALVNSIKELNKKIEKLETRIQTLENKQL
jgi:hypothetical protein